MARAKQDKFIEKTFFDNYPGEYDVLTDEGYERILKEFAKLINPEEGEKMLDLGCGSGTLTARFKRWPLWVSGIDISIKNIRDAEADMQEGRFIIGDIEGIPFKSSTFDIIFYGGVLHHFPGMKEVIREGVRILRPGGRFFSYDPNYHNPFMWLYRAKESPFRSSYGVTSNEILLTKNELKKSLEDAGLVNVFITCISGVTYKFLSGRITQKLLPLYNLADRAIDHSFLRQRYGAFIIASALKV